MTGSRNFTTNRFSNTKAINFGWAQANNTTLDELILFNSFLFFLIVFHLIQAVNEMAQKICSFTKALKFKHSFIDEHGNEMGVVDKRAKKTQKTKREDHNHFISWPVCLKEHLPLTLMAAPLMFYDTITECAENTIKRTSNIQFESRKEIIQKLCKLDKS